MWRRRELREEWKGGLLEAVFHSDVGMTLMILIVACKKPKKMVEIYFSLNSFHRLVTWKVSVVRLVPVLLISKFVDHLVQQSVPKKPRRIRWSGIWSFPGNGFQLVVQNIRETRNGFCFGVSHRIFQWFFWLKEGTEFGTKIMCRDRDLLSKQFSDIMVGIFPFKNVLYL